LSLVSHCKHWLKVAEQWVKLSNKALDFPSQQGDYINDILVNNFSISRGDVDASDKMKKSFSYISI